MEDKIYLGKVSNTHGLKGEIRILSDFERKNEVFRTNFPIIINGEKLTITSYRPHKEYDMVTLKGYTDINDVLKFKGKKVYINRIDLNMQPDDYLMQDLIGFEIYEDDHLIGKVTDVVYNSSNVLLNVTGDKNFYIPCNVNFIKSVDLEAKKIKVENTKGLIL